MEEAVDEEDLVEGAVEEEDLDKICILHDKN